MFSSYMCKNREVFETFNLNNILGNKQCFLFLKEKCQWREWFNGTKQKCVLLNKKHLLINVTGICLFTFLYVSSKKNC